MKGGWFPNYFRDSIFSYHSYMVKLFIVKTYVKSPNYLLQVFLETKV